MIEINIKAKQTAEERARREHDLLIKQASDFAKIWEKFHSKTPTSPSLYTYITTTNV